MKVLITVLSTLLSLSSHSKAFTDPLTIRDSYQEKCNPKNRKALFDDLSNLEKYHTIDDQMRSNIFLLSIPLLDMIQSTVHDFKETPNQSSKNSFKLLIALRPLPTLTSLDRSLYPRFFLQCSIFETSHYDELLCLLIPKKNDFGIDRFHLSLKIFDSKAQSSQCLSEVLINYNVHINGSEFDQIKKGITNSLKGGDVFGKILDLFTQPRDFFNTYWVDFYKNWIHR